jgi:hypothetical protein
MSFPACEETTTPSPPPVARIEALTVAEKKPETKEGHVTTNLTLLLEEHKAQSRIVQKIQDELNELKEVPDRYLQNRKKFLYKSYMRNLDECETLQFDIKVSS